MIDVNKSFEYIKYFNGMFKNTLIVTFETIDNSNAC